MNREKRPAHGTKLVCTSDRGMRIENARIDAITVDFYNTLVFHKHGSGRGVILMEYLRSQGFESDPWEHQVLYDLFERHGTDYSPEFGARERLAYLEDFTKRLFERLRVRAPEGAAAEHAAAVWRALGPDSLGVYPEVRRVFESLRRAGFRLSIVSNWQCGLEHFCHELGIATYVDHILASAEVGSAKPERRIFRLACDRMGVCCERVLHVGDSRVDDVEGGANAGMQTMLLQRDAEWQYSSTPTIRSLVDLLGIFDLDVEPTPTSDIAQKAADT